MMMRLRLDLSSWSSSLGQIGMWTLIGVGVLRFALLGTVEVYGQSANEKCVEYIRIGTRQPWGGILPLFSLPGTCGPTHGSAGPIPDEEDYLDGTLYVTTPDPDQGSEDLQDLQEDETISWYEQPFVSIDMPEVFRVTFDPDESSNEEMIGMLSFLFPERDFEQIARYQIAALPNDTLYQNQWYLNELGLPTLYEMCGSADQQVKVAVIDNWFELDHPDLSFLPGYDVGDKDDQPVVPDNGPGRDHGTIAAWLLGAKTNNGEGIASYDNAIQLIPIKASRDSDPGSDITYPAEAFAKAVELDADIISASFGAYIDVGIFAKVVEKVQEKGVQIVASAGNFSKSEPFFPAAYPGVIAVAAVDKDGKRAWFSNYGNRVDLAAPGVEMWSTSLDGGYDAPDGTSEATPLVAGAYAYALAQGKSREDIEALLRTPADGGLGKGILDIEYMCGEPICQVSYPQLDYNDDGQMDNKDINMIKAQLNWYVVESCEGRWYDDVCCPEGEICDLDANGKLNHIDPVIWHWIWLKLVPAFDMCGDGIDNDCDGQIDDPVICN